MKRLLAGILILAVMISVMPVCFAEEGEPEPGGATPNGGASELLTVDVGDGLVCYVTGVSADKQTGIAAEIKEKYSEGGSFEFEDPVLTDAEKNTLTEDSKDPDCDARMCWAGSISNTLWETGWGENLTNPDTGAAFTSEDELMQYFRDCFTDGSNKMEYGIQWFLNGVSQSDGIGPGWAATFYPDSEAEEHILAPEYSAMNLVTVTPVSSSDGSISGLDRLLEGTPINISVEFCEEDDSGSTHAMTATGLIVDPAAEGTDGYYRYILLANTDNSVTGYEEIPADKRPNIFTCYPLALRETAAGETVWEIVGYVPEGVKYTRIKTIYYLPTYGSEEAEAAKETDSQATMNAVTTPDLILEKVFTSLEEGERAETTVEFNPGEAVVLNFTAVNASRLSYDEKFYALVTLKRESDGETVEFYTECQAEYFIESATLTKSLQLGDVMTMKSGKYSVSVELNPKSAPGGRIDEAYYLNNLTLTQLFTILGSEEPVIIIGQTVRYTIEKEYEYDRDAGAEFALKMRLMNSQVITESEIEELTVRLDGETVDRADYEITVTENGDLIITLSEKFMDSLDEGRHGCEVEFGNAAYRTVIIIK